MGSMTTNGFVHADTCVSNFYCDIDINGVIVFLTLLLILCEWTFIVENDKAGSVLHSVLVIFEQIQYDL